ncbi:MAG: antibiotic biosynthesis monooxygenase [Verrucomicrobia bacterium]|nr:antibiotic biosynthesis monooxygenase [Verrucomicrobiota bacterium]
MKPKPLTVVATIKAKSGKEAELRKVLQSLLAPTRKEAGCLNYDLHASLDDPRLFIFHENWTSKAHLDVHLKSPHIQAFIGKAPELLAEPVQIMLCEKVG